MEPAKAKACFCRLRELEMRRHHQRIIKWQSFFECSLGIEARSRPAYPLGNRFERGFCSQAKGKANIVRQFWAVERVEMQPVNAFRAQSIAELGTDRGG